MSLEGISRTLFAAASVGRCIGAAVGPAVRAAL